MAFDGFITRTIISELKNIIINAKINKVWQPNKTEIILGLYNNGKNYSLLLSSNPENCRINLTNYSKSNPQNAYNFCMLLRKYLVGAKIINISNMDLERTVEIKVEAYNEMNDLVIRKLYLQIMSRQSNIILTNHNNIIIDCIKHSDSTLPAHEFEFTPILKTSFLNITDFKNFIKILEQNNDSSIISKLTNTFIGFSVPCVTKALESLKIDQYNYTHQDLEKIYNYFKNLINNINSCNSTNYSINIFNKDYTIFLEDSNKDDIKVNSFIDNYYFNKEEISTFTNYRNNLLKIILNNLKKLYKKLENINNKLNDCNNMELYKLYGELLTANLYKVNNNTNLKEITLENYYDNYSPITIPLDSSISIQKNIEKFYKKYNKLKNTLEIVGKQKQDAIKEIDYIESIVFSLENATQLADILEIYDEISQNIEIKKKISINNNNNKNKKLSMQAEMNFQTFDIKGYKVYVGKNNIQNDYLSLKFASKNDYWFHTQTVHGSHVILKTNNETYIDDEVLYECAKLASKYSKASNSSNTPVDYCLAKYVKKPSGSKPGKVIYNNYKTIYVK
ncbi:MAG: NFACT family protein [Clostridia bacterium]|nr:NFACT family protein [Clostridia bacterium]